MKQLSVLNKYFFKYRKRFFLGVAFIILSNYFRILSPQISGYVVNKVTHIIQLQNGVSPNTAALSNKNYDALVKLLIQFVEGNNYTFSSIIILSGISLLILALLGGFFMFLMRQTIIVMSRYIEFDQKNEIFKHYQKLDISFYKANSTGDLMNRISEDVSRVRMYTGPAIMYVINLTSTIIFCLFFMIKENAQLTLYVLAPLPFLAIIIYFVNTIIHKKSTEIQEQLSHLTTTAQESYSGIRVIKSFVQEKAMLLFFNTNSEAYKKESVGLAKLEAVYFPTMALLIGISTLITIAVGGWYHASNHQPEVTAGTITAFVIYVNLLTFPVSAIGWTASMIQRAAASQKRLNEFLQLPSAIKDAPNLKPLNAVNGTIIFNNISFTYTNTGIQAIKDFSATINEGEKVLVIGKTGSGKTTLAQLLLRFYNTDIGNISIGGNDLHLIPLHQLRTEISYIPQDVFLFSDSVANNIGFGMAEKPNQQTIEAAAIKANINTEIKAFDKGYETLIGERGVTLSGGQKQRIAIARGLIKNPEIVLFDDCLSAVDAKTEAEIVSQLTSYLQNKTAIIITHRIFSAFTFNKIIVLENGTKVEEGTHESLMQLNGFYAEMYRLQLIEENK